jgi:multidrug efflux pump subunit AcrA (membrane-fusion protein)
MQQIQTTVVRKQEASIPVIAPAHVVASIASGQTSHDRLALFESADVTSLYSQFHQNRANAERTAKGLVRIKEMYDAQAATAKDLNDAEAEAANARFAMAESESKLRGLGFNPVDLDKVRPGTIWLICDVAESQLQEVQKGEDVTITFSSLPGTILHGHADAIGEVVDPATRTVKVRVSMSNRQGRIFPGMFARVDFGDPIPDVFVLPTSAVVTVEGADYVFAQTTPTDFERRPVVLASSGGSVVIVRTGVHDSDRVVVAGAMLLKGLSFGY